MKPEVHTLVCKNCKSHDIEIMTPCDVCNDLMRSEEREWFSITWEDEEVDKSLCKKCFDLVQQRMAYLFEK